MNECTDLSLMHGLNLFAGREYFDCNAACCVLKRGPTAAFKLVNCQEWSMKTGPPSERGGGSH